jgi:hypothetical protein
VLLRTLFGSRVNLLRAVARWRVRLEGTENLMARDNSPKERQKKQLERKQGRRASFDRILIVSEGNKWQSASDACHIGIG